MIIDVQQLRATRKEWCKVLDSIARIRNKLDSGYARNTYKLEFILNKLMAKEQELWDQLSVLEEQYTKEIRQSIRRKANGKPISSSTNVFGKWKPLSDRRSE